jgi:hypothetical protein
MAGGLLQLVSYGKEDERLIGNPEITFFKIVYHKHTNFSLDTLHTLHTIKYGSNTEIIIPQTGELLYKLFIKLDLPEISVIYKESFIEKVNEFINNIYYNYSFNIYNSNKSNIFNIVNLINNNLNIINNEKNIIQFFSYINNDGKLSTLYNLFESSFTMAYSHNLVVNPYKTQYFLDRSILQDYILDSTVPFNNYLFKNYNFFNEQNYYYSTDYDYFTMFNNNFKSIMSSINLNNKYEFVLITRIFDYNLELILEKNSYMLSTSVDYYNDFKNKLLYSTIRNEYLRQEYNYIKNGYDSIDDLMIKFNVNGRIILYDDVINNIPRYLVFIDKTNITTLTLIYITDIYKYIPTSYNTISTSYYNYTGYIVNLDYMNNLIILSNKLNYTQYAIFNIINIYKSDGSYNELVIKLKISKIDISFDTDKVSILYVIYISTANLDYNYNLINNVTYLSYIANNDSNYTYNNTIDNTNYNITPTAILLIDRTKDIPIVKDTINGSLIIYCKNTIDTVNMNNLQILSPYIPILNNENSFFNLLDTTNTDYKLQLDYAISNNFNTINTKDIISSYSKTVYSMLNAYLNTINVSFKNTINKDTLTVILDIQTNKKQLNNYKNILNISSTINNTLLDKINSNFDNYLNKIINSYSYIVYTKDIYSELVNIYKLTKTFSDQLTNLSFINSFDTTNIFSFIYEKDGYILTNLTYNDIILTKIENTYMDTVDDNFYKLRLYPDFVDEIILTQLNNQTDLLLNDAQKNYIIPNNILNTIINITYDDIKYDIKYTYTILHVLNMNKSYADVYVKTNIDIYQDGILQENLNTINLIITQEFINVIPLINNKKYVLNSEIDTNISYVIVYSDNYPLETGDTTINGKYKLVNYYLTNFTNLEDIWCIQQNYSSIYDIIAFPSYFYGKFKYDIPLNNVEYNNNNIFIHDIYIFALYSAYKNLLYYNNNIVSNITSLLIQEIALNISSYYKDPSIQLNNLTSQYELSNTSLQEQSIDSTQYITFSATNYNLINILSNSLFLNSEHILNTSFDLIQKYDRQLLNYLQKNIIYTIPKFPSTINKYINLSNNYLNYYRYLKYLDFNTEPINILTKITNYSNSNYDLVYDNKNNYTLENDLVNKISNNIIIYDISNNINNDNKQVILNILNIFNTNFSENFNYLAIINNIQNINGKYYNKLVYENVYNIVNLAIKNYLIIYLNRGDIFKYNNYLSLDDSVSRIIDLFIGKITDFTSRTEIMTALLFLQQNNYITTAIYLTLLNTILNVVSYETRSILLPDTDTDNYKINTALSFYTATLLLQATIKNNAMISTNINLTYNIYTSQQDPNYSKLLASIITNNQYSPNIVNPKLNSKIQSITNDRWFLRKYNEDLQNINSLTYFNLYTVINNSIKQYILLYIRNTTFLNNTYSKDTIISLFTNSIIDYTNIDNILNSMLYCLYNIYDTNYSVLSYYSYLHFRTDILNGYAPPTTPYDDPNIRPLSVVNGILLISLINESFDNINNRISINQQNLYTYFNTYIPSKINTINYYINVIYYVELIGSTSYNGYVTPINYYIRLNSDINTILTTINKNDYIISRYTIKNIINNLPLYTYYPTYAYYFPYSSINRDLLLNILNYFKQVYNTTYNIQNLITNISNNIFNNAIYLDDITYNQIFSVINSAIQTYICICMKRIVNIPQFIIDMLVDQVYDYTDSTNIINTLNYLTEYSYITYNNQLTMISLIRNPPYILPNDPVISDNYLKSNALDFKNGLILLNMITTNNSDFNYPIYDANTNYNLINKQILIDILNKMKIYIRMYPIQSYDIENLLIKLISGDNNRYSNVIYFSDIYNILKDAVLYFLIDYFGNMGFYNSIALSNCLDYDNLMTYMISSGRTPYHGILYQHVVTIDPNVPPFDFPNNTNALHFYPANIFLYYLYSSNLVIYDNTNSMAKKDLINTITLLKLKKSSNDFFDYDNLLINVIQNSDKIVYNDIYTIINEGIKNYIYIYVLRYIFPGATLTVTRSDMLDYLRNLGSDKKNYLNLSDLMPSIHNLITSFVLNPDIVNLTETFYNDAITGTSGYVLNIDPSNSDGYYRTNALQYSIGIKLIRAIFKINSLQISKELFSRYLINNSDNLSNNLININKNIDKNLIISSIYNTDTFRTIQQIIDTNITSNNTYNILTKQTIDNILNSIILYDPLNINLEMKTKIISWPNNNIISDINMIINNDEILTYKQFITTISKMIKNNMYIFLNRSTFLTDYNLINENFIYLFTSRITDYTNYFNIINALNYLEETNIISNTINLELNKYFLGINPWTTSWNSRIDNYSNNNCISVLNATTYINNVIGYNIEYNNIDYNYIYNMNNNENINNKKIILTYIRNYKLNLLIDNSESYYVKLDEFDEYITTTYSINDLKFYDIKNFIVSHIINYFMIYLIRSNNIIYNGDTTIIYDWLISKKSYFDNIVGLMNQVSSIGDDNERNAILNLIIKITPISNYTDIYILPDDPLTSTSDIYKKSEAISYFRGMQLLNTIKYNLRSSTANIYTINKTFFYTGSLNESMTINTINKSNPYINNWLTPNDLINTETLINTIFNSVIKLNDFTDNRTNIFNIINVLNNINKTYPLINKTTTKNILADTNILDFDSCIENIKNKVIKIIYVENSKIISNNTYLTTNNTISNTNIVYNFIDELNNTNLNNSIPNYVSQLINIYQNFRNYSSFIKNNIFFEPFNLNYMKSIITTCNNNFLFPNIDIYINEISTNVTLCTNSFELQISNSTNAGVAYYYIYIYNSHTIYGIFTILKKQEIIATLLNNQNDIYTLYSQLHNDIFYDLNGRLNSLSTNLTDLPLKNLINKIMYIYELNNKSSIFTIDYIKTIYETCVSLNKTNIIILIDMINYNLNNSLSYNFVNELINCKLNTTNPEIINKLINIYQQFIQNYDYKQNDIINQLFNINYMKSIINLCNDATINIINDFIFNLEDKIINLSDSFEQQVINSTITTNANTILNLYNINTIYGIFTYEKKQLIIELLKTNNQNNIDNMITELTNDVNYKLTYKLELLYIISPSSSTWILRINNLYSLYKKSPIFTIDYMKLIYQICTTFNIYNIKTLFESINYDLSYTNKIVEKYDNTILFSDLNYYDKIYYLYNNLINIFYDDSQIYFNTYSINNINYTTKSKNYTIFIDNNDATYNTQMNGSNIYIGPTLGQIYNKSNKNDKNTYYYISVIFKNINALFNYFSKIVSDPIVDSGSYINLNDIGKLFETYFFNNNLNFKPLVKLLNYIQKYYLLFGSSITSNETIYNRIINNPITAIIYNNLNIFLILLVHIANNYSLSDLLNTSLSVINNKTYYLTTNINGYNNNTNTIILLPNIDTFFTSSYLTELSSNDLNNYVKGVLQYNINTSEYSHILTMLDNQRNAYISLYKEFNSFEDIGINSHGYYDYYKNYLSFDFKNSVKTTSYLIKNTMDIITPNFKTSTTFLNQLNLNKLQIAFTNIQTYYKKNITNYNINLSNINFLDNTIDFSTYYSDIDGFYNYIITTFSPSIYIQTILLNLKYNYRLLDIKVISGGLSLNEDYNNIFLIGLRRAFMNLNIDQIIDLHNFNYYNKNNINKNNLYNDFNNIINVNYKGNNSGNLYKIFTHNNISLVINDYIGDFFTTKLVNINNYNELLIEKQNTYVSEKLIDSINVFNSISDTLYNIIPTESNKTILINLYNDLPIINGYLLYFFNSYLGIDKLQLQSIYGRVYTYYFIIMRIEEYNKIITNNYNFNTNSIGIIIYNKITLAIMNISEITGFLNVNSPIYNFELYRKTDLPYEYEYVFDVNKNISEIKLKSKLDNLYVDLYTELSLEITNKIYNQEYNNEFFSPIITNNNMIINYTSRIITINNYLLLQHKLIKINYQNTQTYIYRIKSITNFTKKIYINFPYDFISNIDSIELNNVIYSSNNFTISKTINISNISTIYNNTNIIGLTIGLNENIVISENYITDDSVKIYLNKLNNNISLNYYLQNDQTVIISKIIGIDTSTLYSEIILYDNFVNTVSSIEFGIKRVLSILKNTIIIYPDTIPVLNNGTLYNLLEKFNTNELINMLINRTKIYDNLNLLLYKFTNIKKSINVNDYLYQLIENITNYTTNTATSTAFIGIQQTNYKNFKLDVFNNNEDNDIISNLKLLRDVKYNENLMIEINNYYNYNILKNNIIDYLNKPLIPTISYIPYLADFIFDNINLMVDGYKIDEIKDAYLYIYHNVLTTIEKKNAYYRLNKNDNKLLIQTERKDQFSIHIEIPFYFGQSTGLAFPLISNLHSNFTINLQIKDINDITIKNKYATLVYKNNIKMTLIYSIVYLEEEECRLFSTMRQEYLYEQKIYNTPLQLDLNNFEQKKHHIPFNQPIKDLFYYIQLQSMTDIGQYYNFTNTYLLPQLDMNTRNKIIYLEQIVLNKYYDNKIYNIYLELLKIKNEKIIKLKCYNVYNSLVEKDLAILYNNLTDIDIIRIETLFDTYYQDKLNEQLISKSQLYLNSIERYNLSGDITNKIVPYQSYTNSISGLNIYNFSLHPLEYQPSGYCNFSSLKPEFRLTVNNLNFKNEVIKQYLFARSYNIIRFISGICGIAW